MAQQLSKSDYMLYLRHPAWLWLKKHDKKKLPPVDENTQAIFDAGFLFEEYAEQLFPSGERLSFDSYQEYLTLTDRTQAAIARGVQTIFQARFEVEDLTCICDIIDFDSADRQIIDLYEVKSSGRAKLDHEFDLAFQVHVLSRAGFTVRTASVIHVNGNYVRDGGVDVRHLTATTDITEAVFAKDRQTQKWIAEAVAVMNSTERPDISPRLASLPALQEWLEIYRGLVDVPEGSVYELCRLKPQLLSQFEAEGITHLVDIPERIELGPQQRLQIQTTRTGERLINSARIEKFLTGFQYPLYFLDYETMGSIVPPFDGLRPYQDLPFQYSLHILDEPGGELRHCEYLHRVNTHPARRIVDALQRDIGQTGTILAWYDAFEKRCNSLLGSMVPEAAEYMAGLNERMQDLMTPFAKMWLVDKGFCGSASIKKVLPVMVPELSYKDLHIQEGQAAQRLWMQAVLGGNPSLVAEQDLIFENLLKYCELDTLAMVRIYEELVNITSGVGAAPPQAEQLALF